MTLLFVAGALALTIDHREGKRRRAEQELRADRTVELLARSLASPVWNVDTKTINGLLDSISTNDEVAAIGVVASSYGLVVPRRVDKGKASGTFTRSAPIKYAHVDEPPKTIGTVEVVFTSGPIENALTDFRRALFGLVTTLLLVAFVVTYYLVDRLIRQPLQSIDVAMEGFSNGDHTARAVKANEDELGRVADRFNTMAQSLQLSNKQRLRHSEELEAQVLARTAALAEAVDRAQVASRAKSAFLANMSHELRTPLNGVLGFAQLLQHGRPSDQALTNGLSIIERSGHHLLGLITDILDLAKIEAGRVELAPQVTDLRRLIDDLIRSLAIEVQRKNVSLQLRCTRVPPTVLVDAQRLRQVLLNLLSNAIKFTSKGEVSLDVSYEMTLDGHAVFRFAVRDSGIGIAAADLARLFRPFEQLGDAEHRNRGTGLGLALSRQLVVLMGGDIEVRSELGQGSEFSFRVQLPLATTPVHGVAPTDHIVGYAGQRRRVLVVDDIELNRQVLIEWLHVYGFETASARGGEEALSQIADQRPDLIFMDLSMPGLSGIEVMQHLRSQPDTNGIPVAAVSASAGSEERAEVLRAGAVSFLAKPVLHAELMTVLAETLGIEWIRSS